MINPMVESFILCQSILSNEELGLCTLVNVYNVIVGGRFPLRLDALHAYIVLKDGQGRVELALDLVEAASETVLGSFALQPQLLTDRLLPHEVQVRLDHVVFPRAGRYIFRLRLQDRIVGLRDKTLLLLELEGLAPPQ